MKRWLKCLFGFHDWKYELGNEWPRRDCRACAKTQHGIYESDSDGTLWS